MSDTEKEKDELAQKTGCGPVILGAVIIGIVGFFIYPRGREEPPEVQLPPISDDAALQKMAEADLGAYSQAQWPKLYARYGADIVLGELQGLRRAAAFKAAKSWACDKVEMSEYAPSKSDAYGLTVYVDCANGFRLYYNKSGVIEARKP